MRIAEALSRRPAALIGVVAAGALAVWMIRTAWLRADRSPVPQSRPTSASANPSNTAARTTVDDTHIWAPAGEQSGMNDGIVDLMNTGNAWGRRIAQISRYRFPLKHPEGYLDALKEAYDERTPRAERIDKLLRFASQEQLAACADELLIDVAKECAIQGLWRQMEDVVHQCLALSDATTCYLEIERLASSHASASGFSDDDLDLLEHTRQYLDSISDHKLVNPDLSSEVAFYQVAVSCDAQGRSDLAIGYLELLVSRQGHAQKHLKSDLEFLETRLAHSPDYALRADDYYIRPEDFGMLQLIRLLRRSGGREDRLAADEKTDALLKKYSGLRYPNFTMLVGRAENLLHIGETERARAVAMDGLQKLHAFLDHTKYPRTNQPLVRSFEEIIHRASP